MIVFLLDAFTPFFNLPHVELDIINVPRWQ